MRPDLFKGNKELSSTICVRDVSTAEKSFPCHSQQLVSDCNPWLYLIVNRSTNSLQIFHAQ